MYQKFIQYAMPKTDALSIYSMKSNPSEQEKCIVELIQDGRKIKYVLNPKTRIFEEIKERNSNNSQRKAKKFPTEPEESGR